MKILKTNTWKLAPSTAYSICLDTPRPLSLHSRWNLHKSQRHSQVWVFLRKSGDIMYFSIFNTHISDTTVGWNPANQLRLVVFPTIYRVSAASQVVVWDFSHQLRSFRLAKDISNVANSWCMSSNGQETQRFVQTFEVLHLAFWLAKDMHKLPSAIAWVVHFHCFCSQRWFFSQRGRLNAQLHRPSTQVTNHCWTKQGFEGFRAWHTLRSNNQHYLGGKIMLVPTGVYDCWSLAAKQHWNECESHFLTGFCPSILLVRWKMIPFLSNIWWSHLSLIQFGSFSKIYYFIHILWDYLTAKL